MSNTSPPSQVYGITARAILIGLICAALECLIAPYNDYVIRNIFLAGGHFPVGPFFVITVLILLVNVLVRKIHPGSALKPQEIVTIWCIMIVAVGIPSTGLMRNALSPMVAYKYKATMENDWEHLFHQYIPQWRVVQDQKAILSFYEGLLPGESVPWSAWLKPVLIFSGYVLILYFVMACLSILLRKQWVENEKCTFPLVRLPVEMSSQPQGLISSFFKSPALWLGFAFPVGLHTMNGIHAYFPKAPHIPRDFWLNPFLVGRPFSLLRPIQIVVFWSMVGFSYLLSLDVSFSLWFFFIFYKLQSLIGGLLGFQLSSGPGVQWTGRSFSAAQEAGACLTFVAIVLVKSRHHIKSMFLQALDGTSTADDPITNDTPGITIFGLLAGVAALVFFNHLLGMSLSFALAFVLLLLAMYIALTWQVINGGIPFINPSFSAHSVFLTALGTERMSRSTVTSLLMHPISLTLDLREFMMPNIMNSLKAADEVKVKRQQLLLALGVSMVIGLVVSYYSALKISYQYGAPYTGGSGYLYQLESLLLNPKKGTDWTNTGFMLFGSLFTLWLMWMRQVFLWWPFHPIGYMMLSAWASFKLWFSIFLGWSMKFSIVKYGGLRAYRSARPIFLGLVLGEMVCAGLWAIIGMATGISTGYRIMPD